LSRPCRICFGCDSRYVGIEEEEEEEKEEEEEEEEEENE
jgi:hypothetical protein